MYIGNDILKEESKLHENKIFKGPKDVIPIEELKTVDNVQDLSNKILNNNIFYMLDYIENTIIPTDKFLQDLFYFEISQAVFKKTIQLIY